MGSSHLGKFYDGLLPFAMATFNILVTDSGQVFIDGDRAPTSYSMEDYSTEEAIKLFVQSPYFKSYCKTNFYSIYLIKAQII